MNTKTSITRRYHFECAHFLPKVPDQHKCKRMHGHNYEMLVTVAGQLDERGFLLDFFELDEIVLPIIAHIDHRVLNDIPGLENPTAELIGAWFAERIVERGPVPRIKQVRIYETKDCWADIEPT